MNKKYLTLILSLFLAVFQLAAQKDSAQIIKAIEKSDSVIIRRQHKEIDLMYDSVYQWRIKQTHLDDVYIPMDLLDCFKQLDKLMEEPVKKRFMEFSDEDADRKTHASMGLWIDHKWKLTDGSRLSAYFRKMGVPHPDYMVGVIITSYHRHLHKRDLKVKEQVAFFKEKWKKEQKEMAKEIIQKN